MQIIEDQQNEIERLQKKDLKNEIFAICQNPQNASESKAESVNFDDAKISEKISGENSKMKDSEFS